MYVTSSHTQSPRWNCQRTRLVVTFTLVLAMQKHVQQVVHRHLLQRSVDTQLALVLPSQPKFIIPRSASHAAARAQLLLPPVLSPQSSHRMDLAMVSMPSPIMKPAAGIVESSAWRIQIVIASFRLVQRLPIPPTVVSFTPSLLPPRESVAQIPQRHGLIVLASNSSVTVVWRVVEKNSQHTKGEAVQAKEGSKKHHHTRIKFYSVIRTIGQCVFIPY